MRRQPKHGVRRTVSKRPLLTRPRTGDELFAPSDRATRRQLRKSASTQAVLPKRPRTPTRVRRKQSSHHRKASAQTLGARVSQVVGLMRREHLSLAQAAKRVGISARVVVRESGTSLQRLPNGRYRARASDRLLRVVRIPTADGIRDASLRNSKDTSLIGEYWNAVHGYLAKGDTAGLDRFRGRHITAADGERIALLTDHDSLDRLGSAGVLSFESMYAKVV